MSLRRHILRFSAVLIVAWVGIGVFGGVALGFPDLYSGGAVAAYAAGTFVIGLIISTILYVGYLRGKILALQLWYHKAGLVGVLLVLSSLGLGLAFPTPANSPILVFAGISLLSGLAVIVLSIMSSVFNRSHPHLPVLTKPTPLRTESSPDIALVGVKADVSRIRKFVRIGLMVMVFPLTLAFLLLLANFLQGILISAIISLFFLGLVISNLTIRRSLAVEAFLPSVSVGQERIALPDGVRVRTARVLTSGFYSRGYNPRTKLEQSPTATIQTSDFRWPDNPWGASLNPVGVGWFEATVYLVDQGPYKDLMLIPIQPSTTRRGYAVQGSVEGGTVMAQISVEGPVLRGEVTLTGASPRSYEIRLRGKSGRQDNSLEVEPKGAKSFVLQTQPLKPLVIVAHRKMFNPLLLMSTLHDLKLFDGGLFGGTGLGAFNVELVLHTHIAGRGNVFSSEPIDYS